MMNAVPNLGTDYDFLKKLRNQTLKTPRQQKVSTKFLLHPKRLLSDSECSLLEKVSTNTGPAVNKNKDVSPEKKCLKTNLLNEGESNAGGDKIRKPAVKKSEKSHKRPSPPYYDNFDKKFQGFIEKTIKLLANIRTMLEKGIPPPDGEEDSTRRFKRLQEFSTRFSRTYLYPLLRQMDELSTAEKIDTAVINQKLIYAQQIILQGVQAYYNHLPTSIEKCCTDKLQSLLEQILYSCQLFDLLKKENCQETTEFVNVLRTHSEVLSDCIKDFDVKFKEKQQKNNPIIAKKSKISTSVKNQLSMYATTASFRRDRDWKKAVESLAKKRFNVKSKYKTAQFKHRPPVAKNKPEMLPSKGKLIVRTCSSEDVEEVIQREDEIETLVELENELEAPPNTGKNTVKHASVGLQLVRDDCDHGKDNDGVKKALAVLKEFLAGNVELDKGNTALEIIEGEVERKMHKIDATDQGIKKYKNPIITVSGAKNAKLICIRDDNSPIQSEDEAQTEPVIKVVTTETQTDVREKNQTCEPVVKISRLPKQNGRPLPSLPKDFAINIIQYKLNYSNFLKHNPMYRKSSNIQPWVLMGRVSDQLLEDILRSVTSELEVTEIIENLYNAEFQY